jgi:hypothetical protein
MVQFLTRLEAHATRGLSMRKHFTARKAVYFIVGCVVTALVLRGVASAVTSDVFKYSTPQTGFFTLHPAAFAPNADVAVHYSNQWPRPNLIPTSDGDIACLNAGINLPQGAIIRDITVWMTSNTGKSGFTVFRTNLGDGGHANLVEKTDTDTSGMRMAVPLPVPPNAVDNSVYAYGIGICLVMAFNKSDVFHGARITYTYRSADD